MHKKLFIKNVDGKGRGVFCKQSIAKNEVFEVSPVLVIPVSDCDTVKASRLVDYFFSFNKDEGTMALALGFGSLYNHAVYSNSAYTLDRESKTLTFHALEDIPADEEISINYGGQYGKVYNEWFETRNINYQ